MKNIKIIFLAALWVLLAFAGLPSDVISADQPQIQKEAKQPVEKQTVAKQASPYAKAKLTIKIIPSVNKTFGYDILMQGKPLIHQPNIPALPGNDGFKTKQSARKVAEFVVKKIRKNEMPPTVTVEDLKRMQVLK